MQDIEDLSLDKQKCIYIIQDLCQKNITDLESFNIELNKLSKNYNIRSNKRLLSTYYQELYSGILLHEYLF